MPTDHLLERLRVLLADRYRFETLLGRGGSATVYTVTNLRLDRLEALKVLQESQQGNAEFADRFANEAKVAASLDHPSIVKVYDYGDPDGICWYSMQLVDGPTLSTELRSRGTFEAQEVVQLFLPILDALAYSHDRGVVHRDIKPSNINIDPSGRTFLMDFGIAKSTGSMLETRTGLVLGTPAYVAPEQASGQPIDGRADLYSVGITLYQMLCGAFPFTADNILQTVVMRINQDPEPLRDKLPAVDPRLERVIMRALARNRNERFADVRAMREALSACAGDSEQASFVPEASGPGRGVPLFDSDETNGAATKTYVATSKSEAKELRSLRRQRQVRQWTWIAGTGLVVALSTFVVFGIRSTMTAGGGSPEPIDGVHSGRVAATTAAREEATPGDSSLRDRLQQPVLEESADAAQDTPVPATPTPVSPTPVPPTPEPPRQPWERPQLLDEPTLSVPAELARVCSGTTVRLSLRIDENGAVAAARVLSSGHAAACAEHAEAAVRRWRYEPAKDIEGLPLPASLSVAFPYSEVTDESPDDR